MARVAGRSDCLQGRPASLAAQRKRPPSTLLTGPSSVAEPSTTVSVERTPSESPSNRSELQSALSLDLQLQTLFDDKPPSSLQVANTCGKSLVISACGRSVAVNSDVASSLTTLQSALQHELHMEGQLFQFFDVHGTHLVLDSEVHEAIAHQRIPLVATLSDASIHFIENRREELAQMQWKLVRDQMTGATGKIAALARQIEETAEMLQAHKREVKMYVDSQHVELKTALEALREEWKLDLQQVSERTVGVVQSVTTERNLRELANTGMEKQLQGLMDSMEVDRTARKGEAMSLAALVEDGRKGLEAERGSRTRFEDRHTSDLDRISSRIETLSQSMAESIRDVQASIKRVSSEGVRSSESCNRIVEQIRSDSGTAQVDVSTRFTHLEDRCASLEARLCEASSRQTAGLERLAERNERIHQVVEKVRLEERLHHADAEQMVERLQGLEHNLKQNESEAREMCAREQRAREERLSSTSQTLMAYQQRHIEDLESKFRARMEQERSTRTVEEETTTTNDSSGTLIQNRRSRSPIAKSGGGPKRSLSPPPLPLNPSQTNVIVPPASPGGNLPYITVQTSALRCSSPAPLALSSSVSSASVTPTVHGSVLSAASTTASGPIPRVRATPCASPVRASPPQWSSMRANAGAPQMPGASISVLPIQRNLSAVPLS